MKNLHYKVNSFDQEMTGLYKNVNELKALQTLNSGKIVDKSDDLPKSVKEIFGFWGVTR